MINLTFTADCGCKLEQAMMVRNMRYPSESKTYSVIGKFNGDVTPCDTHKEMLYPGDNPSKKA